MARKPMTPQEYEDWFNSLLVDNTPLPETELTRLHPKHIETMFRLKEVEAENERLRAFVEDHIVNSNTFMMGRELWTQLQQQARALLASLPAGGADGSE